jgi:hypothetical protein
MRVEDLLLSAQNVDALLAKFVTQNEDSGRHGVVIPVGAYSIFPPIPGFRVGEAVNYTVPIRTMWSEGGVQSERSSSYKHYHRYPERRVTGLRSPELDNGGPGTLVILARRNDGPNLFEVHVLPAHDARLAELLPGLGFEDSAPGMYVLEREWRSDRPSQYSSTVAELLKRFDALAALGKVTTLRAGPTGIGFTLEHHMGVAENNSQFADFDGVELKSLRSSEFRYDSPERTSAENSHGLRLVVDTQDQRLYIEYKGERVGYYARQVLERRLREKLTEMLVVLADSSGKGASEQFRYHSVIHCAHPSIDELARLVEEGHVFIELRMHVPPDATPQVRNHGTGFRIRMSKWPELFALVRALRGTGKK